jgi:hypothetical protein
MFRSREQFIREQGFGDAGAEPSLYQALMFQPRAVGALLVIGAAMQSSWFFAALSGAMWWSALVPAHNPFDAVYNAVIARRVGVTRLASGTGQRRFAAGMAGSLALAIAGALMADLRLTAWVLEAVFASGVGAVVFARFCAGALLRRAITERRAAAQMIARRPMRRSH